MQNLSKPSWDQWFMSLAFLVSTRSPDPDTKHGSVLCNDRHQILGVGYNGYPRGCDDAAMPKTRPQKYLSTIHSEVNCLHNSQNLMLFDRCSLYVTGFPCSNCFIQIAQNNVAEIVYGPVCSSCVDEDHLFNVFRLSNSLGVTLRYFGGPFIFCPEKYRFVEGQVPNPLEDYVRRFEEDKNAKGKVG